MTTVIRKILSAALLGAGFAVSMPASADVELVFGIYAADNRVDDVAMRHSGRRHGRTHGHHWMSSYN